MAPGRNSLTANPKNSAAYSLRTTQEPQQAKVYLQRDKGMNISAFDFRVLQADLPCLSDRKPLEPPPVIEILLDDNDPYKYATAR
jgi:hypothetical protein